MRPPIHSTAVDTAHQRARGLVRRACGSCVWIAALLLLLLMLTTGSSRVVSQAPRNDYQVIAHPGVSGHVYERRFLTEAFLKKITAWPDGKRIHPIDLPRSSTVRDRFSSDVLGRSVTAVGNYWRQIIFSGRGVPPAELASDADVVRFVLRHPGAVGYVSQHADLQGAKPLRVE